MSEIPESDIWCVANLLIREHGIEAEIVAARRADEMRDRGDIDGQRVWMRISRAIGGLQASTTGKPNEGKSKDHEVAKRVSASGSDCRSKFVGSPQEQDELPALPCTDRDTSSGTEGGAADGTTT